MKIEVNDKVYTVKLAVSPAEKKKGLQNVSKLDSDEGMLFIWETPQTVGMWMKDVLIPLDIIFINEDLEVISVYTGNPGSEVIAEEDNVAYVLELNADSGVKDGDEIELNSDSNSTSMKVIAPDGSTQMTIDGGERIFSRKNTKVLIKQAKKANNSKSDSDYKRLGKSMFKYLKIQDNNEPEFVELKDK